MNNNCNKHKSNSTSPTSNNYNEKIKNNANKKTPYGVDEPSSKTTYK